MSPMTQYEAQNAAMLIDGYFLPRPLEQTAPAFERAKAECLKHMRRSIECLEAMSIETFRNTRRPIKPATPNDSEAA